MTPSLDIDQLRQGLRTSEPPHGTTCIVRSVTDTHLEAQFDPDAVDAWVLLPLSEIRTASVLRQVSLLKGTYTVVRLELQDDHPQVEIAALTAQVNRLLDRDPQACGCDGTPGPARRPGAPAGGAASMRHEAQPMEPGDPGVGDCHRFCKRLKGCEYWGCMFGCTLYG